MFPGSKTNSDIKLKITEGSYIANFEMAPYFIGLSKNKISKSPIYAISLDGSSNETTQTVWMNLIIWCCDETDDIVKARYIGWSCFDQVTAKNLLG